MPEQGGEAEEQAEVRVEAEGGIVEAKRAEAPLSVRWISGSEFARQTARDMGRAIKEYIPRVALGISPYRFAAKHLFWMFISLPLAILSPLFAVFIHPAFLLLLVIPLAAFVSPWARLKTMVGDRKRNAREELPFFAVHAAIAQTAGFSLYQSLTETIDTDVFKQVKRSARFAKRNVKVLGRSPMRALEELGKYHPEDRTKSLFLGYTSEQRSGGDLASYLSDRADEFLNQAKVRWEDYRRDVGTIAEIVITALFILPVLVLMTTFLSPGAVGFIGFGFVSIGLPMILAVCAAMIRTSQPKDYTEYPDKIVLPALFSPIAFVVALLYAPLWIAVSIAVGVGCLLYGIPVLLQKRRVRAEEGALPDFLRDVTEYQKLNYPLRKAIGRLYREREYAGAFQEVLGSVVNQLETGRRLAEVDVPTKSWLTRLTFFHLGQIAESGGFAIGPTEQLANFMRRMKNTRDRVVSEARIYRYLSVSTPIVLTLICAGMSAMFGLFTIPEMAGGAGAMAGKIGISGLTGMMEEPPLFDFIAKAIILVSSVGVTFLTSYASDLTPKNLTWSGVGALLAAVGMALMPKISAIIQSFLGF